MVKSFVLYIVLAGWCGTALFLGWHWFDTERDLGKSVTALHTTETNLDACRRNASTLEGSITLQNTKLDELQQAARAAQSAASQALASAQQVSEARAVEINRLKRRIAAPVFAASAPADACLGTVLEIQRNIP